MPEFTLADKDKDGRTAEDYEKMRDSFSDEFRGVIGETLLETVDSYLLTYGDPKQYRHYVNFAGTVLDGVVCYLLVADKLHLDKSVVADEETITKRREEKKQAHAAPGDLLGHLQEMAVQAKTNGYQPVEEKDDSFGGYI